MPKTDASANDKLITKKRFPQLIKILFNLAKTNKQTVHGLDNIIEQMEMAQAMNDRGERASRLSGLRSLLNDHQKFRETLNRRLSEVDLPPVRSLSDTRAPADPLIAAARSAPETESGGPPKAMGFNSRDQDNHELSRESELSLLGSTFVDSGEAAVAENQGTPDFDFTNHFAEAEDVAAPVVSDNRDAESDEDDFM
mmetsp:Transcript_18030/g.47028  ORF Transcript_18030/g.47028 Transcript_18030/m.47028 type:complete len:197 (-) Transcript_18030:137-727(-)